MISTGCTQRDRIITGLACLVMAIATMFSSCASQAISRHGTAEPRMFWTLKPIEEGTGKGTLYVQGTLHLGRSELYPLSSYSLSRMAECDTILAELSNSELLAAQAIMLDRLAASLLPDGTTLLSMLPENELTWIQSFMGVDTFKAFARYEPWVAMSALELFTASKAGLDSAMGVDARLFDEAARLGRRVDGLETAEFQMRMLSGYALADQLLMLRDSIRESRDNPCIVLALYEAYRDDQRQSLASHIAASIARSEAFNPTLKVFNESLLYSRNADWARQLRVLLDAGLDVYLFAGAAHFVGKGNVIELLEAYGYRDTQ